MASDSQMLYAMRSYPTSYLYNQTEAGYELYLGEYSSLEGLELIDKNTQIESISFGGTNYKKYGWATEKELPHFETVNDLTNFLVQEEYLGIVVFEVTFKDLGLLNTHDDGECHFKFKEKGKLIEVVNSSTPEQKRTEILAALLENPDMYIAPDESNDIKIYHTFDQYLESSKSK